MLKKLSIKNYALIDKLTVEFGPGLNILTGETGAGKSIIIGALSLLLGERAKSEVIRQGASQAVVEGFFDFPFALDQIKDGNEIIPAEDGLLLRREIHKSGRNRIFANDSPITNNLLSNLGDLLVDLHGQHAHQTLLKIDQHLEYLDNYGVNPEIRNNVSSEFKQYHSLTVKLQSLLEKESELRAKKELLEFQVKEISQANPSEGEDDELGLEEKILNNSEKIFDVANQLNDLLYEGEGSVTERISAAEQALRGLLKIDTSLEKWIGQCESARITIDEIVSGIQSYVSKIEFDQDRLEKIRERLEILSSLKKKFGGSIKAVISFLEKSKQELNEIETLDESIQSLNTDIDTVQKQLILHCQDLSALRKKIARQLEVQAVKALTELGLKNGVFRVDIRQNEPKTGSLSLQGKQYGVSRTGIDNVEFFISMNPGEDPRPLAKIASGGEISRIMLALKSVLAKADNVPVLIFDEIDTGISGRIARVVGHYLKEISKNHQVICITHLPQIASMGDRQFCVEKETMDNRTFTKIRQLTHAERVKEIAKLLGGDKITETNIQSARELMNFQGS